MTILHYPIEDRAAWLQWRLQDLTASDIGAAIGVDPYKTPAALFAEKTGVAIGGADNAAMRRGRWFEHAGVAALEETFPGWDFRKPRVYCRDPIARLGGTPDCISENPEAPGLQNMQVKTVSRFVFERDWINGPPLHYALQTAAEGYLLDAVRSFVVALVVDAHTAEIELFEVPRHAGAEQRILEICDHFWQEVDAGRQPAFDFTRDGETIAKMYARVVAGPPLDLSADNRMPSILAERAALKAIIETNLSRVAAIEAEVKAKLGPADQAELPGWRISWKEQHRKEHTVKATSFRKLTVTNLAKDDEAA